MKTKHTPGPYNVVPTLDNCLFIAAGNKDICMIQTEDGGELTEEDQANAKLFAAAPELLEALNECMKHMTCHKYDSSAAYNKAKSLIKKVTV
jgi:hypothetical protein